MTPEGIKFIKTQWIPALRSGKYIQGRCALRTPDDKFCCLGVACDLLTDKLNLEITNTEKECYKYNNCDGTLPEIIIDYLGFKYDSIHGRLIHLNDVKEYTFNQIADYLEGMIAEIEYPVTVLH